MNVKNQKQTFLGGAVVLALSTAVVKIIGALYKLPLMTVIGDEGYGYFTTAYDIYSVLLMISTTGLPVAMSRMISEAKTLGRNNQIRRVYRTSMFVFLSLGVVGAGGMFFLCRWLAGEVMHQSEAWFAVACLAPAVLFIGIISAYRGYFQGQGNMKPTSISQVFEALCKLLIGLALAMFLKKKTGNLEYAAGGAILGVTLGTVVGTIYLAACHRRAAAALRDEPIRDATVYSYRHTAKVLLAIAIPITLGSAGLQLINLFDSATVMARLKGAAGFTTDQANLAKGIYNVCQTIFNLPCAFITPLTVSIIPAITEHLTLQNHRGARMVGESAIRVMALIALPCSVGLAVLSSPVLQLLRGYTGANLATGATLLSILGLAVFFNSIVLVLNAIMQAHGHVFLPVINMIAGGIVKILVNFFLVGTPSINIIGAPVGTVVCYITITALNVFAIKRVLRKPPRLLGIILKPLLAALIMGVVAFGVNRLLLSLGMGALVCCVGSIGVAGIVYLALVYVLKIITLEDCSLLPKGDKIAKFLRIH